MVAVSENLTIKINNRATRIVNGAEIPLLFCRCDNGLPPFFSRVMDHAFTELIKRDKRYKAEAYTFVFEVLEYAQQVLKLGKEAVSEPQPNREVEQDAESNGEDEKGSRHLTGQELCQAASDYARLQYGLLAKAVLNSIGIFITDDIGEIVYNLIEIGQMRKTPTDSKEDFKNVFDIDASLV